MSEQIFKAKKRGHFYRCHGLILEGKTETTMSRPKGKKRRLTNRKDLRRLAKLQRCAQRQPNKRKAKINDKFLALQEWVHVR